MHSLHYNQLEPEFHRSFALIVPAILPAVDTGPFQNRIYKLNKMNALAVRQSRDLPVERLYAKTSSNRKLQEQDSLEFEKKFLVLVGSAFLVQEQLVKAEATSACSLCMAHGVEQSSLKRMRRSAKVYQKLVRELISEKKRNNKQSRKARQRCREWLTHEMKRGRVKTIRRQKEASVLTQQCVSCGGKIENMSKFLKGVDKLAQSMQSGLHTHTSSSVVSVPSPLPDSCSSTC